MAWLGLLAVAIAGFGAYRAYSYGSGGEKQLAALPIVLVIIGGLAGPFVIGFLMGARKLGQNEGAALMMTLLRGSLVLAAGVGALFAVMYRPPE